VTDRKGITLNQHRRRIDQVLDPAFVSAVEEIPLDELRRRRGICEDLDAELSYYRRLLHGRMDLLSFEIRRRSGEETRSLIEALPDILAEGSGETAPYYLVPKTLPVDPPEIPSDGRRSIDLVLADDFLTHLPDIDDAELQSIQAMLTEAEERVSTQRRAVYEILEKLTGEVARRYRDGLASITELLND
jgi:hypothetical protein